MLNNLEMPVKGFIMNKRNGSGQKPIPSEHIRSKPDQELKSLKIRYRKKIMIRFSVFFQWIK